LEKPLADGLAQSPQTHGLVEHCIRCEDRAIISTPF